MATNITRRSLLVLLLLSLSVLDASLSTTSAFAPIATQKPQRQMQSLLLDKKPSSVDDDMNPLTRASWYAVEAFGKVFGTKKGISDTPNNAPTAAVAEISLDEPPSSLKETLDRIQLDNDRSYFLSGQVDKLIYAEDCVFADPFVSFAGRDRFVDNLQNLGSFITKYSAKMLDYTSNDTEVQTTVMVKLELNLPWKPVLAWPWGVRYEIDPDSFLITLHEESWNIDPWEGVKQIFRKPTTEIK